MALAINLLDKMLEEEMITPDQYDEIASGAQYDYELSVAINTIFSSGKFHGSAAASGMIYVPPGRRR